MLLDSRIDVCVHTDCCVALSNRQDSFLNIESVDGFSIIATRTETLRVKLTSQKGAPNIRKEIESGRVYLEYDDEAHLTLEIPVNATMRAVHIQLLQPYLFLWLCFDLL